MKMGEGVYRPAFNVHLATDGESHVIVGVTVTNSGNDGEQMAPMQSKIKDQYGKAPGDYLVDCGFPNVDQVKKSSRTEAESLHQSIAKRR